MSTARLVLVRLGLLAGALVLLVGFVASPGGDGCGTVFLHPSSTFDTACEVARGPWKVGLGIAAAVAVMLFLVAVTLPRTPQTTRDAPATREG